MNPTDELRMIATQLPYKPMTPDELSAQLLRIADALKPQRREYPGHWEAKDSYVVHSATERVILIAKNKYEASNMCELHNRYYT